VHKINISIDDISPHPQSSIKALDNCFRLLNKFPNAKFTLFIPTAYTLREPTYLITSYPDFCTVLKDLPQTSFELGWHGHFHGVPGINRSGEFQNLNLVNAIDTFRRMFDTAEYCKIKDLFKPIFRPPAFVLSNQSAAACAEVGITSLSLRRIADYQDINKSFPGHINYCTSCPPYIPMKVEQNIELVYHACEWSHNFIGHETRYTELVHYIEALNDYQFIFFEELKNV
jgi:predicted deacetylase